MLYPSYIDLMNAVNDGSDEDHPVIKSRYSIVMAAAKRARQLVDGAESMVDEPEVKPLSKAIDEINEKKVTIIGSDGEE